MLDRKVDCGTPLRLCILALNWMVCLIGLSGIASAQSRAEWPQSQPAANDPTLVRQQGFSIPPASSRNTPPPINQPSGQRIFPAGSNANTTSALPTSSPSGPTRSAVQPASWSAATSESPSKAKSRVPIEIRSTANVNAVGLEKPNSSWSAALSMILSLAVVLSFFLLVAWLVKKSQPKSFLKLPGDVVQVMGRTPMAPRQQMYVVRFGSKLLLISHQPGQTQTLGEISDADEVHRLAGLCEANHPGSISNSFRDVLKQVALGKSEPESKPALRLNRGS